MSETKAIAPPDRAVSGQRSARRGLKTHLRGELSVPGLALALVLFAVMGAAAAWALLDPQGGAWWPTASCSARWTPAPTTAAATNPA